MSRLILIRHGRSVWNDRNIFTGCVDIPLSQAGIDEAIEAGKRLADIPVDRIYTSALIRAQMTALLVMSQNRGSKVPVIMHEETEEFKGWGTIYGREAREAVIPVVCAWQLNERMYGELQGMNKAEMAVQFGDEQVRLWRRSYDICPPHGESLALTAARTIPYFNAEIVPHLAVGRTVLVAAHGNSLRSILMELDGLTHEEVLSLEVPTGVPISYEYTEGHFSRL